MKANIAAALVLSSSISLAQAPSITGAMTVSSFAVQCQHPAMKSDPDRRSKACTDYLGAASRQLGEAIATPECWEDLERFAPPMAVADALFYMATQLDDRNRPLAQATREVLLIAAKRCSG